ncbi:MAG TPA: hypothetical protein PKO16_04780, partial [Bacteroidia bacterium]|nr:hypothetical protein [Bacteroidia bacterium]
RQKRRSASCWREYAVAELDPVALGFLGSLGAGAMTAAGAVPVLPILDIYINKLEQFKEYLKSKDYSKVTDFIKEANRIRKVLDK